MSSCSQMSKSIYSACFLPFWRHQWRHPSWPSSYTPCYLDHPPNYRCLTTRTLFLDIIVLFWWCHRWRHTAWPSSCTFHLDNSPEVCFSRGPFLEESRLAKASGIVHAGSPYNMTFFILMIFIFTRSHFGGYLCHSWSSVVTCGHSYDIAKMVIGCFGKYSSIPMISVLVNYFSY